MYTDITIPFFIQLTWTRISRELFTGSDSAMKTPAGSKGLARFREEHGEFATAANDGSDDDLDADYRVNNDGFNSDIYNNRSNEEDVDVNEGADVESNGSAED
jgi:hypothetical protein